MSACLSRGYKNSLCLNKRTCSLTTNAWRFMGGSVKHKTRTISPCVGNAQAINQGSAQGQQWAFHIVITHINYTFNYHTLILPQYIITAYSCKPNQGKPAYLHKTRNEKYNDFTNKMWIRMRICDKHFVSRRIESDFLSWRLFQAHLTQSVPLSWCAVSYTHQVISG